MPTDADSTYALAEEPPLPPLLVTIGEIKYARYLRPGNSLLQMHYGMPLVLISIGSTDDTFMEYLSLNPYNSESLLAVLREHPSMSYGQLTSRIGTTQGLSTLIQDKFMALLARQIPDGYEPPEKYIRTVILGTDVEQNPILRELLTNYLPEARYFADSNAPRLLPELSVRKCPTCNCPMPWEQTAYRCHNCGNLQAASDG